MPRFEDRELWVLRVETLSSIADSFSRSIN
jgi:hypothetical protein